MRMKRTGRSRVSAITQTPASGPFGPVTTPPMSSLSMVTACCACNEAGATQPTTAIPIAATPVKRILRIVMPLAVDGPRPGLAVAGEGEILETYFAQQRSEEHTSELQSLRHLVCRLLLEKKKQNIIESWLA